MSITKEKTPTGEAHKPHKTIFARYACSVCGGHALPGVINRITGQIWCAGCWVERDGA